MKRRPHTMFFALGAVLLVGLSSMGILACGEGDGSGDPAGPEVLQLPEGARYGAWSPDGEVFAIPAHDKVELIGTDGDLEQKIDIPGIDNSGLSCECRLAWTERGEIHIVTRPRPRARGGLATVDADGKNLRSRDLDLHVSDAAWAPQGWPVLLIPGSTVHHAGEKPPNRYPLLRLNGLNTRPNVFLQRSGEIVDPAFSPDGSQIAFSADTGRGQALWIVSADGEAQRLLLRGLSDPGFAWSPDGRRLALSAVLPQRDLRRRLFLVSLANGEEKPLTRGSIAAEPPAWTPDGRWITFADEEGSIKKIRPDGSGQQVIFRLPGEEVAGLNWSPDGRHLALTSRPIPPID